MNKKICCITNEGKTAKNECEKYDSSILQVLYSVYKN